jgi:hypothetical protein
MSRRADRLERREDGWWWSPELVPWPDVAARLLPEGGRVGVPGGQAAFDYFLAIGFTGFHLSRTPFVRLPGGRGLFSAVERGESAHDVLIGAGLAAGEEREIDPTAGVTLRVYAAQARSDET